MIDIRLIRADKEAVEKKLQTKDPTITLSPVLSLDERIRVIKLNADELKATRNHVSKEIGEKKRLKQDTTELMDQVSGLGDKIAILDRELQSLEEELSHKLALLPNIPADGIKVSLDPKDNVCIKEFGQKREFSFPFKNHVELNDQLHLFDFKRGAKVAGSGWPTYRGMGARLEWALINYMIDIHLENGFEMWMPPTWSAPR